MREHLTACGLAFAAGLAAGLLHWLGSRLDRPRPRPLAETPAGSVANLRRQLGGKATPPAAFDAEGKFRWN